MKSHHSSQIGRLEALGILAALAVSLDLKNNAQSRRGLIQATFFWLPVILFYLANSSHVLGGTVVAWGENSAGQTNVPVGLSNVVAVAAGWFHSLALKSDGTVVGWGSGSGPNVPFLTNVVAISAREESLALKRDGTVVAWGGGPMPPPGLSNVVAIAAGGSHSLALRSDGRVIAWGGNDTRQTNVPPDLRNVTAIAAGSQIIYGGLGGGGGIGNHNLALRADGAVVTWGYNVRLAVPPGLTNIVKVAAGYISSFALRSDGKVIGWGLAGVPEGLSNIIEIVSGGDDLSSQNLALREDGTVAGWGWDRWGATLSVPPGLSNVVGIAAGDGGHSVALVGAPRGVASPEFVGSPLLIATANENFYHRLRVANGVTSFGASGMPAGLILDSVTGIITGKPSVLGTFPVIFSATNDIGSAKWPATLFVNAHPLVAGIGRSEANLVVSWPAEYVTAILESSPATDPKAPWGTVPGSENPRTVNIGSGNEFFRLRIP